MAAVPVLAALLSYSLKVQQVGDAGGSEKDTRVGNVQYVAAATSAYNVVEVNLADDTIAAAAKTATVTNLRSGTSVSVPLPNIAANTVRGKFSVGAGVTITIAAIDGDTLNVSALGNVKALTVDAKGPTVASMAPATGFLQKGTTVALTGQITDTASSIASDKNDVDGNGVTNEPLKAANGSTVDIQILVGPSGGAQVDKSLLATWLPVTDGFSFTLQVDLLTEGDHTWQVIAKDKAGNATTSDSDTATAAVFEKHKITVDATKPCVAAASTGIGWDAAGKKEKTDKKSVKLEFTGESAGQAGTCGPTADLLDSASLFAGAFTVEGNTVSTFVFPNLKAADTDASYNKETRNVVFLTLGADLAPASKPQVAVVGIITDKAGNPAVIKAITASDKLKPTLSVSIVGEASSRPVVSGKTTAKATLTITSNEELTGPPTVTFSTLATSGTSATVSSVVVKPGVQIGAVEAPVVASVAAGGTSTAGPWEVTRKFADGPNLPRLANVFVTGTDKAGANVGTAGSGTTVNTFVDPAKLILFEFDNQFNGGVVDIATIFKLNPVQVGSTNKTESQSPFVRMDFDNEGLEYNITGASSVDSVTSGETKIEIDSHNKVTLLSVKLDGADVLSQAGTVDDNSFQIATANLALGKHKVEVTAKDAVGNETASTLTFEFEVVARSAHKVALVPGFNLVSFPGDPVSTAINDVVGSNAAVKTALTYDPNDPAGPWLVATRDAAGQLSGTLTTIDGNHAYWIETTNFDPIQTVLAARAFSTVPPSIPVIAGWNLVPVADLQLGIVGTAITSTTYFASVDWAVAYRYDAATNQWVKVIPTNVAAQVKSGEGWWLFANKKGSLVP